VGLRGLGRGAQVGRADTCLPCPRSAAANAEKGAADALSYT
jgi:hypothetical protein